ncbi:MAG TPA: oligoribonuclease [Buchnera sp. (in: enterobacteria)]|nr:oligoribonuclease [Buchnera sp. (in: enterobacteria)]
MNIKAFNLIWIDLEMTGLNPEKHKIIEIATLVTNKDLQTIATGPAITIYQSNKTLNLMNTWNKITHSKNGLINKVKKSLLNEQYAELHTINFLKKWTLPNTSPMCGNSIHQDRKFLKKYMPKLEKYFHYRHIDVSTLKELALRWKPSIVNTQYKNKCHNASNDIHHSIKELLYYRKHFIK